MVSHILTKEYISVGLGYSILNLFAYAIIQKMNSPSQHLLKWTYDRFKRIFWHSLPIWSTMMRQQHKRLRFLLQDFFDGWYCAYITYVLLTILLGSAIFLSLIGTLKSALITTRD
jgi:hypothetical protein